jgi:MFS family permease
LVLFTDMAVYDMVVPFLPDYGRPLGVGEAQLGLLFGSYAIALLLTVPIAGRLSDRLGAGRSLRLGAAGLLVSLALYAGATGPVMLFAARAVQGVAGGLAWTAGLALLASAYPTARRGRALGTAMAGMSLGTLIGPPTGGVLFDLGGARLPFVVAAVWTLLVLVGISHLPDRAARVVGPPVRVAWRRYFRTAGAVVIGSALLSALEPTLPLYLEGRLGVRPAEVGVLFGWAALIYGLTAPAAGWAADRWGGRRVIAVGLVASAVTLPAIAWLHTSLGVSAVLGAFGAACAILLTPTLPEIAAVCERHGAPEFGAAYAVFNLAYAGGMAGGPIVGGVLAPLLGFGPALIVLALVAVAYLPVLVGPPRVTRRRSIAARQPVAVDVAGG